MRCRELKLHHRRIERKPGNQNSHKVTPASIRVLRAPLFPREILATHPTSLFADMEQYNAGVAVIVFLP